MKFWTKVLFLGAISFIALTAVAFLIALTIENDSTALKERSSHTNNAANSNRL